MEWASKAWSAEARGCHLINEVPAEPPRKGQTCWEAFLGQRRGRNGTGQISIQGRQEQPTKRQIGGHWRGAE